MTDEDAESKFRTLKEYLYNEKPDLFGEEKEQAFFWFSKELYINFNGSILSYCNLFNAIKKLECEQLICICYLSFGLPGKFIPSNYRRNKDIMTFIQSKIKESKQTNIKFQCEII